MTYWRAPHASPAGPSRALLSNTREQQTITGVNDCTGEAISGTGELHTDTTLTRDAVGGVHVGLRFQVTRVRLTGSSGSSYVGVETSSDFYYFTPGGAGTETYNFVANLVGLGRTPNAFLHLFGRITYNADGTFTQTVDRTTVSCH